MKKKLFVLSFIMVLFYSGCSGRLAKPRVPQTLKPNATSVMYKIDDYNRDFEEYRQAFRTDLLLAKRLRDALINRIRADVETNYREYESLLFFDRAKLNVGADFLELGLAFATTVSNGERVKTVLGSVLTGFKGTRLSIDKSFFQEKSTEFIISKMQANRTNVRNRIVDKMTKLSAEEYTFEEAFVDLAEFFHAGTLQSAIVAIANEAGKDAVDAQESTERNEFARTASLEDLKTLTEIRNEFRELFRSWDAVRNDQEKAKPFLDKVKKALTELGIPFKETDTGDDTFRILNEQITKAIGSPDRKSHLKRLADAFEKAEISK